IQNRVFVRVVSRARAKQLGHQRSFPAEAAARYQDRLSFPADHPRVNKDPAASARGYMKLHIRLEYSQELFNIKRAKQLLSIAIKNVESANARPRSHATDYERVQPLYVASAGRFPARRKSIDELFEHSFTIHSNTHRDSV